MEDRIARRAVRRPWYSLAVAQEPKSQTQDASSPKKEERSARNKGPRKGPPRDGKNKRGTGKGGRRQGGGSRDRNSSNSPLTTGLFSGMADKRLPCKIKGCKETFIWTAQEQLRSFGKPPPQRMCEIHLRQLNDLADKTLPCRNAPACENTWVWKRGAQLHARQRQQGEGPLRVPSRLCESCYAKEKEIKDQEVECRTQGCSRTWVWTRDAQIRHRAWLRREQAKVAKQEQQDNAEIVASDGAVSIQAEQECATAGLEAPAAVAEEAAAQRQDLAELSVPALDSDEAKACSTPANEGGNKKRKRRKKPRRLQEGPPERHCNVCAERFAKIVPVELPCKVHGCKNQWVWDRVGQLKAWVALGTDDTEAPIKPAKRMCGRCRDFCKTAKERDVACANESCDCTWRFKVGAQLQHVLATGGVQDPRRLCEACVQAQYKKDKNAGAELMPCAKPGCDGTWLYVSGMPLAPDDGSEIPADRLCNACRLERGLEPRAESVVVQAVEPEFAPETTNVDGAVAIANEAASTGASPEAASSQTPQA